jgi:hypothetical protein
MTKNALAIVAALLAGAAAGCGENGGGSGSDSFRDRGSRAVEACRRHGGVAAIEDEVVICTDHTSFDRPGTERGSRAVAPCRRRGGVRALDDDVVICADQTVHQAKGG